MLQIVILKQNNRWHMLRILLRDLTCTIHTRLLRLLDSTFTVSVIIDLDVIICLNRYGLHSVSYVLSINLRILIGSFIGTSNGSKFKHIFIIYKLYLFKLFYLFLSYFLISSNDFIFINKILST